MHAPDPLPPWLRQQRIDMGRRIAYHRMQANLTQEGLAERAECSRQTIVRIETGATSPSIDRLLQIERALGVPPADLLPGGQV